MKTKTIAPILIIVTALACTSGCGSKKESAPPSVPEAAKSSAAPTADAQKAVTAAAADAQKAMATTVTEAQKAVEPVKAAAQTAVADATKTTQSTAAAATAKAQEIIDKAKALVADNKFQEGLTALNSLAGMTLTPDQQKMVDDLKATIQKALSSNAAKAVGNILGGGTK